RTPVFDTRFGRVSLQICYDSWFPELTRTYAVKGSLLNLVISAGPSGSEDAWKTMLRARSMENAFPSVYCNTVGRQKDVSFFGGSKIVSAAGKVTTEATFDEEDFVTGAVDLQEALRIRRHWLLFRERAPELYAPLTATYGQIDMVQPPGASPYGVATTITDVRSGASWSASARVD
ncbi:MAG: carbon-nitrogen hydrolase family protein, partial [Thermomicrobiales bacterium]